MENEINDDLTDEIQLSEIVSGYNPKIFTNIYRFAGILFSLSALFPIIKSSGRIKLFWNPDMTPALFIVTALIIVIGVGIGVLAERLEPSTRSKLFFFPMAGLLTIANLLLGLSDVPSTGFELAFLVCIYAPFLYFAFTILVSVFDVQKLRFATCITGIVSILLFFIPTFAGHSLYEYAFENNGTEFWILTFSTLSLTVIYNLFSYFLRFLRDNAKFNVYLLVLSYLSIAVSAIMSVMPTPLSNLSDYLKLFFAAYGIFFLMTFSLVEMYLIGKENRSAEFAQPITEDISE